jgi:hypothetical protein
MDDDTSAYHEEMQLLDLDVVMDDDDDEDIPLIRKATRKKFDGPNLAELYPGVSEPAANSVEKKIQPVWATWEEYFKSKNYDGPPWQASYGLGLYGHKDETTSHTDFDNERVDGFFTWLLDEGFSKTAFLNAKTFLNINLRCEYTCRLKLKNIYAPSINVSVGESQVIKRCLKACNARTSTRAMIDCVDIQAELHHLLSPQKIREMLLAVLKPKPNGLISKMELLNRLTFGSMYTSLSQTTRRGEELYGQKLVQRATTSLGEIGPFGIQASQYVTNKAKHNKEGWLEYTATLPHMDPLRDSSAWFGFIILFRLLVNKETFPNFTGNNDSNSLQSIFGILSYPSSSDPRIPISPELCGQIFKRVFQDCDAVCAKVVHQPRFQAIQELDRAGLSETEWTRMSGHKGKQQKVHQKSYAHNPPSRCLVQRAGGDFQNIKGFNPSHFLPTPEEKLWLDEILNLVIPAIMLQHSTVCELYEGCKDAFQRKERRLYTIKGMLDSAVKDVQHFVMMMACPLVDPNTFQLDPNNTQSLWRLYHNESLSVILNHQAFRSTAFQMLESSTLTKMQQQSHYLGMLNNESRCALINFCNEHVARPVYQNQLEHQTLMLHLQQSSEIQSRKMEELKSLLLNANTTSALPTVTPDKRLIAPVPTTTNGNHAGSTVNDTLADGRSPRKRRVPITQLDAISVAYKRQEEETGCVTHSIELLCDRGLHTLDDYWNTYISKWRPLEIATSGAWRQDFILDADGKKRRQRSSWWTQRVGMFKVIEHYMSEDGLSEAEALSKATVIYNGAKKDSSEKKPGIKALNMAFKKEMENLGIKSDGRPKKTSNNKQSYRKRRRNQSTSTANNQDFETVFGSNNDTDLERILEYDTHNSFGFDDDSGAGSLQYWENPLTGEQTNDDSHYYRYPTHPDTRHGNEGHLDGHGRNCTTSNLYSQHSHAI